MKLRVRFVTITELQQRNRDKSAALRKTLEDNNAALRKKLKDLLRGGGAEAHL